MTLLCRTREMLYSTMKCYQNVHLLWPTIDLLWHTIPLWMLTNTMSYYEEILVLLMLSQVLSLYLPIYLLISLSVSRIWPERGNHPSHKLPTALLSLQSTCAQVVHKLPPAVGISFDTDHRHQDHMPSSCNIGPIT